MNVEPKYAAAGPEGSTAFPQLHRRAGWPLPYAADELPLLTSDDEEEIVGEEWSLTSESSLLAKQPSSANWAELVNGAAWLPAGLAPDFECAARVFVVNRPVRLGDDPITSSWKLVNRGSSVGVSTLARIVLSCGWNIDHATDPKSAITRYSLTVSDSGTTTRSPFRVLKEYARPAVPTVNSRSVAILRAFVAPDKLIEDAFELLAHADACGVRLPDPRLTDDGEIMFYSRKDHAYLDLGVHGDGTYSFFCRDAEGREFSSDDDLAVISGLDENVCRVLRDLA